MSERVTSLHVFQLPIPFRPHHRPLFPVLVPYSIYSFTISFFKYRSFALSGSALGATPLWDIGINGTGQFVQVTDTGFDDASCFLRGDAGYGNGASLEQVQRSTWSSPVTDFSKRKVRCIESRSRL
mgnify:CR=1 FL=1